jgi:hypothetical protein
MASRRGASRLITAVFATLALAVTGLVGADEAAASPGPITTVRPNLGVHYVTTWQGQTPATTVYEFQLTNTGITDATHVNIAVWYEYQNFIQPVSGPCCTRQTDNFIVPKVPAGGTVFAPVICHGPYGGACRAAQMFVNPGDYLVDPQYAVAASPS